MIQTGKYSHPGENLNMCLSLSQNSLAGKLSLGQMWAMCDLLCLKISKIQIQFIKIIHYKINHKKIINNNHYCISITINNNNYIK